MCRDSFAGFMGIKLLDLKPGYARTMLTVREEMLNFHGVTHGGAVFALADAAFAAASNSHGQTALALNVSIAFLKATGAGETLTATASEENRTPGTALYRVLVEDESGELVALAQGIVYRKKKMLLEKS
ncbi:MAG: hydroxyphenylacetyl-CoA thioesterase PaaI [Peptococcaceae bacterium]|nr:MAG: hydroxyphenylacetyl-CoA thioesterase PaaI [Peptococcaceae bacterium]